MPREDQRILLAPQTGAGNSAVFTVGRGPGGVGESNPVTIIASNLAGAETADLQIRTEDAAFEWIDVLEGGNAVELTATNNVEVIAAPGVYRVAKDTTAGSCGTYDVGCYKVTAAGTTVSLNYGSLSFTGQSLSINAETLLILATGVLNFTGQSVSILQELSLAVAALNLDGVSVNVNASTLITLNYASLNLTGQSLLPLKATIDLATATLNFAGQSVTLKEDTLLTLAIAALNFEGQSVTVDTGTTVARPPDVASSLMKDVARDANPNKH